ncbi:MAG: hypothetical protein ACK55S_08415 [Planctomycetota bacterium]
MSRTFLFNLTLCLILTEVARSQESLERPAVLVEVIAIDDKAEEVMKNTMGKKPSRGKVLVSMAGQGSELQPNDVLISINGKEIKDPTQFNEIKAGMKIGDEFEADIYRPEQDYKQRWKWERKKVKVKCLSLGEILPSMFKEEVDAISGDRTYTFKGAPERGDTGLDFELIESSKSGDVFLNMAVYLKTKDYFGLRRVTVKAGDITKSFGNSSLDDKSDHAVDVKSDIISGDLCVEWFFIKVDSSLEPLIRSLAERRDGVVRYESSEYKSDLELSTEDFGRFKIELMMLEMLKARNKK